MTHFVDGVYCSDPSGHHVIVKGGWAVPQADGSSVSGRSVACYDLVEKDGSLFIEKLEIYAVCNPSIMEDQGVLTKDCYGRIRLCW